MTTSTPQISASIRRLNAKRLRSVCGTVAALALIPSGCAWVGSSQYEIPIVEAKAPSRSAVPGSSTNASTPGTRGQLSPLPGSPALAIAGPSSSAPATMPNADSSKQAATVQPPSSTRVDSHRVDSSPDALATIDLGANSQQFLPASEPLVRPNKKNADAVPPLNLSQITFATEGADFDPCVSPDGTKVVYASTQHRDTADIYVKPTDGKVITQLTNDPANDVMPVISPDGQHIAFASDRAGNWDIYVMPISGGRAVQITNDATDELHPSWSPDGKNLVFCRLGTTSGRWEMWVVDTSNQAVSNFIGYGLFPTWCPIAGTGATLATAASDKILFQLGRERGDRSFGVWSVDYKDGRTGNSTEIASSSEAAFINPTWSPDGTKIVYVSIPNAADWNERANRRPTSAELWMLNTDGSGKVNLTGSTAVALMPNWGPNERLYFVANRGGADNIWSIDLDPAIRAASINAPTGTTRSASKSSKAPSAAASEKTPADKDMAAAPEEK